jgi:hypothetical protein
MLDYRRLLLFHQSQKDVDKTSNENRIEIRRGDTLPDVYNKMSHLKEDDIRGKVMLFPRSTLMFINHCMPFGL